MTLREALLRIAEVRTSVSSWEFRALAGTISVLASGDLVNGLHSLNLVRSHNRITQKTHSKIRTIIEDVDDVYEDGELVRV